MPEHQSVTTSDHEARRVACEADVVRLDRRSATAAWLARVASHRPGVVQRAVVRCGSLDTALDAPLRELRAAIAPRRAPTTRALAGRANTVEATRDISLYRDALGSPLPSSVACPRGSLLVAFDDELYPPSLRLVFDPPPALFVAGRDARRRLQTLAAATAVAVVGTRAPSAYGLEMARLLAADLARAGVVVVSGVALGIDVCAQVAALEASGAAAGDRLPSVGVLGCGVDVVHPRSNAAAFRALRERGLLMSEFWPGTPPSAWRFPARNRVIAGLSGAVVVVEGSRRSGSRITADLALDAGREILAVPGEAGRRLSEAPHQLLRQGAHLCEAADDVLAVLGLERSYGATQSMGAEPPGVEAASGGTAADPSQAAADPSQAAVAASAGDTRALLADAARAVLGALRDAPGDADELAGRAGLEARAVAAALSTLEVEGLAERTEGGVFRLRR